MKSNNRVPKLALKRQICVMDAVIIPTVIFLWNTHTYPHVYNTYMYTYVYICNIYHVGLIQFQSIAWHLCHMCIKNVTQFWCGLKNIITSHRVQPYINWFNKLSYFYINPGDMYCHWTIVMTYTHTYDNIDENNADIVKLKNT